MDKLCEITIEIGGYGKDREKDIQRVCMVEWDFREDDFFYKPSDDGKHQILEASALGMLSAGENADETRQRLEQAVWRANRKMCHVEVCAKFIGKKGIFIDEECEMLAG